MLSGAPIANRDCPVDASPRTGRAGRGDESLARQAAASIDRLTEICRDLPECEIEGGQHHKLSVGGKTVGWHTVDHHGDDPDLAGGACSGGNEVLIASDLTRSSCRRMSRSTAMSGSISSARGRLGPGRELVTGTYLLVAPKRLSQLVRWRRTTPADGLRVQRREALAASSRIVPPLSIGLSMIAAATWHSSGAHALREGGVCDERPSSRPAALTRPVSNRLARSIGADAERAEEKRHRQRHAGDARLRGGVGGGRSQPSARRSARC